MRSPVHCSRTTRARSNITLRSRTRWIGRVLRNRGVVQRDKETKTYPARRLLRTHGRTEAAADRNVPPADWMSLLAARDQAIFDHPESQTAISQISTQTPASMIPAALSQSVNLPWSICCAEFSVWISWGSNCQSSLSLAACCLHATSSGISS